MSDGVNFFKACILLWISFSHSNLVCTSTNPIGLEVDKPRLILKALRGLEPITIGLNPKTVDQPSYPRVTMIYLNMLLILTLLMKIICLKWWVFNQGLSCDAMKVQPVK